MKNERFILQQLQRNNKVYSVCLKIFSVALAVFAIVLVITLFMGAGIAVTAADLVIMAVIALQYPVFRKLHKNTTAACKRYRKKKTSYQPSSISSPGSAR